MNCERKINKGENKKENIPLGSGKFKPEKLCKESERWNKTFGSHEEGTVDEAGTSNPSGWRGCQIAIRVNQ